MALLSVKVFYIENKATKEIRKFNIEGDVSENFEYLTGKIRQAFPDLLRKDLELFWKDDEEDFISISSDEELTQALDNVPENENCLKFYVKAKKSEKERSSANEEHPGIVCDGCDMIIKGIRYKCMVCFDYDLCSSCEGKGLHPDGHDFICIKKPRPSARFVVKPGVLFPCEFRGKDESVACPRGRFSCKDTKNKQTENDGPSMPRFDDVLAHIAHEFGLDLNPSKQSEKSTNSSQMEKENEDLQESESSESKKTEESYSKQEAMETEVRKENVEAPTDGVSQEVDVQQMLHGLAQQFGFNPDFPQSEGVGQPFANLGEVMGRLFGNMTVPDKVSHDVEDKPTQKPEDFIVVDTKPTENKLTEEQKYEQRLEKAIRQMEAMGFDNDGGWLRQLLISKDLSIGKVLDALNPSV